MTNKDALLENLKLIKNLSDCIYSLRADVNKLIEPDEKSFYLLNNLTDGVMYSNEVFNMIENKLVDADGLFSTEERKAINIKTNNFTFDSIEVELPVDKEGKLSTLIFDKEVSVCYKNKDDNVADLSLSRIDNDGDIRIYNWDDPYSEDFSSFVNIDRDDMEKALSDEELEK